MRRRGITRRGKKGAQPAEDLLNKNFAAPGVDKVWVADITYVATHEGFLYLAFILDNYSRRIVGWAMEGHENRTRARRPPDGGVQEKARCRSGPPFRVRGSQYTALSFSERLGEVGIIPSMGRTGTALDNAMAESFVWTLKAELVSG